MEEESLFYKIEYRLNRLYEVMQENKNSIAQDVYKRQELKRNCEQHQSIPIQLPMRENMGSWSSTELPTM